MTRSQSIHADFSVLKIQNTNVSIKDLYEMRLMFEPQAAYYACLRASDEELETIMVYGEKDELMILSHDPRWYDGEQRFHNAIASAAHNQFITALLPIFNKAIHQGVILADQSPDVADMSLRDHRLLMDYLRKRKAEAAKAAMYLHMINTMHAFSIEVD